MTEIYPEHERRLRAQIAHSMPRLTPQQVEQQAIREEAQFHDNELRMGRNPHVTLHHLARPQGITTRAERDYGGP